MPIDLDYAKKEQSGCGDQGTGPHKQSCSFLHAWELLLPKSGLDLFPCVVTIPQLQHSIFSMKIIIIKGGIVAHWQNKNSVCKLQWTPSIIDPASMDLTHHRCHGYWGKACQTGNGFLRILEVLLRITEASETHLLFDEQTRIGWSLPNSGKVLDQIPPGKKGGLSPQNMHWKSTILMLMKTVS